MEFFYHPWYMAAGGVLISSPILIHLINRMRFKRIRWAAMEFLLKSQKRNRRKLIIEQLILLLLRILLVLLAAFLVARFVYGSGVTRGATHVVIVDDTLSLLDRSSENGKEGIAYETSIEQVKELAKAASEAASAQYMKIFLLSEIDKSPIYDNRLSDRSVEEIDRKFTTLERKPSMVHARALLAFQKGRGFLEDSKGEGQKVLHFISDFRERDWLSSADAETIKEEISATLEKGININLVDVAYPRRSQRSKSVTSHNNLALLDLRAETRVATEDTDIEFTALLMNNGTAKEKTFFEVFINGEHDLTRDVMIEDLEPGKLKEHRFTLRFTRRPRPGSEITEKDSPDERERKRRLEREQFHIRCIISKEEAALNADNCRDIVVEVRKKVPTLVVDGTRPEFRTESGDMLHLESFYAASGTYEIEERRLADLEKADLDLYPAIILLNVGEIPAPVVKKLKTYVQNGGAVCYFMGEEVKPEHYNNVLFKEGIFPLLITDRPYDPLFAAGLVEPEKRKTERERLRQKDNTPKILFPNGDHQMVRRLALPWVAARFKALNVNVYWQAQPRSRWDPDLRKTEPLIVLPNTSSVDKYKARAVELGRQAYSRAIKLSDKESEYKRYLPIMQAYERQIINSLARQDLYGLGLVLEDMLINPGEEKDKNKPSMSDLWKHPEMKSLAAEIREFRETVLYGDPLLVSRQLGKGRIVAFLSTAGTGPRRGVSEDAVQWNNWGAGEKEVQETYPLFLLDLHRLLVSEGDSPSRLLGEEVAFNIDATRYASKCSVSYTRQPDVMVERPDKIKPTVTKDVGLTKDGNQFKMELKNVRQPGVYRVNLTLLGEGPEELRQETRAFAFNVDSASEGDLRRAPRDRLEEDEGRDSSSSVKRGKLALHVPGDSYQQFKERQPDASESSLLYLFFILILIVEQAMAVHLSFHSKGNEQSAPSAGPAPSPAAAA